MTESCRNTITSENQAMPRITEAYSSFTVPDIEAARGFYAGVLGLNVSNALPNGSGPLWLSVEDERRALVYRKVDHQPASFTVLNLSVDDIDLAVDDLAARGVEFERYPGFEQDPRGIVHGPGHDIAW